MSAKLSAAPAPASIDEAWERYAADQKIPPHLIRPLRDAYYSGGLAAAHQALAGRWKDTAIRLNAAMYQRAGLSEHEIIEVTDKLLDGTFDHPPGYATRLPAS